MNFILMPPSLDHRVSVDIAITLWSRNDFKGLLAKSFDLLENNWPEIEEIVEEKASQLSLPVILKKRLLNNIRQVGLQILSWIQYHIRGENQFIDELPARLIWTPHGTVNNERTAKVLVKDDNLSLDLRFRFTCFYCLEDDISDLVQEYFRIGIRNFGFSTIFCLICLKKNDLNMILYRQLIRDYIVDIVSCGNETVIRYFLLQMDTQNEDFLVLVAKFVAALLSSDEPKHLSNTRRGVLCFLLSTMNVEQQGKIIESRMYEILNSLLVWPRQSLFLEAVKGKWNFISNADYYDLLHDIIDRMSCKQNDFNELFGEFWQQTPETYKQFLTRENCIDSLLLRLRKVKDESNIQLLMEYLSISERKY